MAATAAGPIAALALGAYFLKGVKGSAEPSRKWGIRKEAFRNKPALLVITGYSAYTGSFTECRDGCPPS